MSPRSLEPPNTCLPHVTFSFSNSKIWIQKGGGGGMHQKARDLRECHYLPPQGDSGWAWAGRPGGGGWHKAMVLVCLPLPLPWRGGVPPPPFQCIPGGGEAGSLLLLRLSAILIHPWPRWRGIAHAIDQIKARLDHPN